MQKEFDETIEEIKTVKALTTKVWKLFKNWKKRVFLFFFLKKNFPKT